MSLALMLFATQSIYARDSYRSKALTTNPDSSFTQSDLPDSKHGGERSVNDIQILPYGPRTVQGAGNIRVSMDDRGNVGLSGFFLEAFGRTDPAKDPFTGEKVWAVTYPAASNTRYALQGVFMVGAVVNGDSLVTRSNGEFLPISPQFPPFIYQSRNQGASIFSAEASSELDVISEYVDTVNNFSSTDNRPHKPLGIKVVQRSMSWTASQIDDFIIYKYEISNIGGNFLKDVYVGMYTHGAVQTVLNFFDSTSIHSDELTGFLSSFPAPEGCGFIDTLNLAYVIDNDGNPLRSGRTAFWAEQSARAAVGIRFLEIPADNGSLRTRTNYNWWVSPERWGPTKRAFFGSFIQDNLQPFTNHFATDRDTYYFMANQEVDYDQVETWLDHSIGGYHRPPAQAVQIATGSRPYYLISAGPFDLAPNQIKTVSLALVGGEEVHQVPGAHDSFFAPKPERFTQTLDFSQLAANARAAAIVFDNPGRDTDGDGYAGEFRVCDGDTTWYLGDGVPDYSAEGPPQEPVVRIIPSPGKIVVRWNGFLSETTEDPFTGVQDFEGYRVYFGLDNRRSSLTLTSSYDRENYDRFIQEKAPNGEFIWVNNDLPFTLDSLRVLFNDSLFDPGMFTRSRPLRHNDTTFFFKPQDFNASVLGKPDGIRKVFPEAQLPPNDPILWTEDDVTFEHGEPLPKFYEYEYTILNLLETIPYFVSVTAFDFGFPPGNIPPQESSPLNQLVETFPQVPVDSVISQQLDAYIYPNPYRLDGNYAESGFENRSRNQAPERARRIHFANLPNRCRISIYSIDGDLVRTIEHDLPKDDPSANHGTWDLITRNTQAAVSGIYYWVVESERRTQMGKLIIIK